jgi:hypothetical protein
VGAVFDGKMPGRSPDNAEPAQSDQTAPGHQENAVPQGQRQSSKKRRSAASAGFKLLGRVWIPLVVLIVIAAGALTVSRLHGIFGSDNSIRYGDTRSDTPKPFNPKHMTYEVSGPPGTVAQISYFDGSGDPQFSQGVSLPWRLEFPISTAGSIGSVAAQGDTNSITCRILVDGVVKSEKTSNQVSAFASCILKAA